MVKKTIYKLIGMCKKCYWDLYGDCGCEKCLYLNYNDCAHMMRIADSERIGPRHETKAAKKQLKRN